MRGKSRQLSSEAGIPADLPMPSLTPVVMLTSSRRGGAYDGARQLMVDPRTASGRFPTERPKTSESGWSVRWSETTGLEISGIARRSAIFLLGVYAEMVTIVGLVAV